MTRHEDPWGFDPGFGRAVAPLAGALAGVWWRVRAIGAERVPEDGAAILVANRTGPLAVDALLVASALQGRRRPRLLVGAGTFDVPYLSIAASRVGAVPDLPENAARLLGEGELVCLFPSREDLASGAVAAVALRAGAPIVPTAITAGRLPLGLPSPPGAVALPTRRRVGFGAPVGAAGDPEDRTAVLALGDEVREKLQQQIYDTLAQREESL